MADPISEFGATLRGWRDRAAPEEFGLPTAANRRAPGLRRQELARLAGVSADYLVQLEQGRASAPSPQVLTGLARALRLTDAEREHLFRLARPTGSRQEAGSRHAAAQYRGGTPSGVLAASAVVRLPKTSSAPVRAGGQGVREVDIFGQAGALAQLSTAAA
ncbi:helix-turn-helix domain-containing protein [Streptomyces sp. NPDC050485]|uniref:helix-turn-helix domain-containing protein n=1 Tax=Streptomyces sp. NPDC050485 TaxID=3365617 RepID=UPI00379F1D8F